MAPSTAMAVPATPAQPASTAPALTHPCARCGAPVALDVGLCERCNPLGLKDSASSQVHGTVFLAVGLAIAVPTALATSRLVESFLFRMKPNDPTVLAMAATILVAATLTAGYGPARRASRVDPMVALRHE